MCGDNAKDFERKLNTHTHTHFENGHNMLPKRLSNTQWLTTTEIDSQPYGSKGLLWFC